MPNYNRRFTKEEFQKELFTHLKDMPPGHMQAPKKLEENARQKAEHYARALDALDSVAERIKKIAASHPDETVRAEADAAVKEIDEAINAYGEASMTGNSGWGGTYNSES